MIHDSPQIHHLSPKTRHIPTRQRGAAALIVVSLLLVVMTIILMFANRTVLFEQKTSANQYRSTLAFEAAEAGLAWAQAMLNTQTYLTTSCATTTTATNNDRFKDRYLVDDPDEVSYHGIRPTWPQPKLTLPLASPPPKPFIAAACAYNQSGGAMTCSCPNNKSEISTYTAPTVAAPTTTSGYTPSFAIAFQKNLVKGTIDLVSYGCTSVISVDADDGTPTCNGDANAIVRTSMGQVSGLSTPPAAPLTARGNVSIGNAALGVINPDPNTNGVTINAGGTIDAANVRITTIPGTPPKSTLIGNDASLRDKSEDGMFSTFFGMSKENYKALPTTHILSCTSCTETHVQAAYDAGYRQLWINSELNMNASATIGSETDPLVMVVDNSIQMNGNFQIYGVMYSTATTWNNTGGGSALLRGAAISEGNFTGNGTPDYYYDPNVMRRIRTGSVTFVTIPGSWRDF